MKKIAPLEIRKLPAGGLQITWPDGVVHELSAEILRRCCPCAPCQDGREKAGSAPPSPLTKSALRIIDSSIEEQTRLEEIWLIGGYALGMRWSDGHDTGIYTFELLRELAR